MTLTEPQKDYLKESFTDFSKTLSDKQLKQLYFRLDDLIQYGQEALGIVYRVTKRVTEEREGR